MKRPVGRGIPLLMVINHLLNTMILQGPPPKKKALEKGLLTTPVSFNLGRKINALFLRGRWHLGGNPVKFPWRKVFSLLGGWAAKLVGRGLPAISGPCFSRGPRERNGEMMPIQLEKKHCSCCIEASCKIQKKMGGNKCVDLIPQKKTSALQFWASKKKRKIIDLKNANW